MNVEMLSGIGRAYGLSDLQPLRILNNTVDRAVIAVRSDQGELVVKIAGGVPDEKAYRQALTVYPFLDASGFHFVPKALKSREGEIVVDIHSKLVYVTELVRGTLGDFAKDFLRELGGAVAYLHSLVGFDFPSPVSTRLVISELSERELRAPFHARYRELVNSLPDFESMALGLIHTDIHPGQCVKRSDGSFAIVDWDDAGIGPLALDLGMPIVQAFVDEHSLDLKEVEAASFYRGYASAAQRDVVAPGEIYMAGLL
jgi:Ser/Thr protein kinase RdoA (MazF antagonist)